MSTLRSKLGGSLTRIVPFLLFRFGLFALWQFVPRALRKQIVGRLVRLPERSANADRPNAPEAPYTIVGLASSHTSLGWTTRALVRHLQAKGHVPSVFDVSERFGAVHFTSVARGQELAPDPGTLILNVNPNQVAYALTGIPNRLLSNKFLIGSFVWELETVPEAWHPAIQLMDEIWVPTRFVADAVRRAAPDKVVRVVPYDIAVPPSTTSMRETFGLPQDRFVVLAAANSRSGRTRKNLEGAVRAFSAAFPEGFQATTLLVKLHDAKFASQPFTICDELVKTHDIRVIEDDLEDDLMWCLVASCDAVLSLHRSEGYGLLLKQGLLLGKPVVATGWSGNVDFMTDVPNAHLIDYNLVPVRDPENIYSESDGLRWAEPNVAHAADVLARLYAEWMRERASASVEVEES